MDLKLFVMFMGKNSIQLTQNVLNMSSVKDLQKSQQQESECWSPHQGRREI